MNFSKSSNPVLGKNVFQNARAQSYSETMTVSGAMNRTLVLLLLTLASALYVWQQFFGAYSPQDPGSALSSVKTLMLIGGIGGFIIAIATSFSPRKAGVLAPIYALLEGMFLGGISAMFEAQFEGLVIRAVSITFMIFLGMLMIYRGGIIKVTNRFRKGMMAAIFGVFVTYIVGWLGSLFGLNMSFLYGGGSFGLIFTVIVAGIAAFSLLLDFDFIERGAAAGAPKYMEWYGAFGLIVSLVWLYINILRLLAIIAGRD